jgi:hypothetical protein
MITKSLATVAFGVLFATGALPTTEAAAASSEAPLAAPVDGDVQLGTELIATSDVALGRASIAKGSTVSVRKLDRQAGQLVSVDVELADGYVVGGVSMSVIRASFRVGSQGDE